MEKKIKDKLKIGIYELTGCAGDALLILDCEKELVDIFKAADIQSFLMAKSDNIDGELDVAFVEGSVSTEREKKELLDIRKRAKTVVAIGICACFGGIQAAFLDKKDWESTFNPILRGIDIINSTVTTFPNPAFHPSLQCHQNLVLWNV